MQKLMMRFLLISAFFCFFLSCKSYQIKDVVEVETTNENFQNQYFSSSEIDYVYKTHIEIYGNDLSGIFIVKRINDTVHRMVLTTDFGNKLIDFEISENDFKVNFIMDNLNKKIIINTLKSDFKALLQINNKVINTYKSNSDKIYQANSNDYYYTNLTTNNLHKIIKTNKRKEKVLFIFDSKNGTFAENITIEHKNIKLKIELNQIIN